MLGMPMHEERELPTIYVRSSDLPDFMEWGLNTDHYVVMRVKVVGKESITIPEEKYRGAQFEGKLKIVSMKSIDLQPVDIQQLENAEFARIKARVFDNQ